MPVTLAQVRVLDGREADGRLRWVEVARIPIPVLGVRSEEEERPCRPS